MFCRPSVGLSLLLRELSRLEMVYCFKLLDVFVNAAFNQSHRTEFILFVCNQRLCLLKIRRQNVSCAKYVHGVIF